MCNNLCFETLCNSTDDCDNRQDFNSPLKIYGEEVGEKIVTGYCKNTVRA